MMELNSAGVSNMLETGIEQLSLNPDPHRVAALQEYLDLLHKWNRTYNLSGVQDKAEMVGLHILDSLAVSPYLDGKTILDIGSGAGLPGVPLALFNPDREFILLDSNGKKTRFLFQVKLALQLDNVAIVNKRVEHYDCPGQIDIVISRAFATLARLLELASLVTGGRGVLLAMKGVYPQEEIAGLPERFNVSRAVQLQVPGLESARHLLEIPLYRTES